MTLILVGITCIVSYICFSNTELRRKLIGNHYFVVHHREYWRMLTSGFIHADFTHLLFNMLVLYSFGNYVESAFGYYFEEKGTFYFVTMYLLAIPLASLRTMYLQKDNPRYYELGASGATAAVLMCAVLLDPFGMVRVYFVPMPAIVMGILYFIYEWYMQKRGDSNIGHAAHIDGGIFGIVYTLLFAPQIGILFIEKVKALFL